ncbi:hypothetical protein VIGAN_01108400 [Vigna angularis var. angularis]|uniref:Uncharacterized protein n=1 Tax=Vigna angularis var. angularis TaxID=157739 RepID=A0A0S3QZ04_PHAAN|nr:hypothetical protein VIGAN_01108400 [Vigna angularis var. angularis]
MSASPSPLPLLIAVSPSALTIRRSCFAFLFNFLFSCRFGEEMGKIRNNNVIFLWFNFSEDLEPCRWEILPAIQSNAPQFRVVF